jgi:hypothetical protein
MRRRFQWVPLPTLASFLLALSISFRGSAVELFVPPTKTEAGAAGSEGLSREHEECNARMENFVSELDVLLDVNPRSLEPLLSLLQKYFPLKNCDIQNAIVISRKSKYFRGADGGRDRYVFVFSNAFSGPFSGFNVLFSLLKSTGDSEHPFAQVHIGR